MKRIALILTLAGSPALADITPSDVIESWCLVYAGQGGVFTFDETATSGKVVQLEHIETIEILSGSTTTNRLGWVHLQQVADGAVRITMSPEGEMVDEMNGMQTSTTTFDLSALTIVATGYPGDIRYSYSAPEVTMQEARGPEGYGTRRALTITNLTGEATSRIEITESGPRMADFGEFQFERLEADSADNATGPAPNIAHITAQNVGLTYRTETPLLDIRESAIAYEDFPPRVDMEFEMSAGSLQATLESDRVPTPVLMNFDAGESAMGATFSRNQFSTDFSTRDMEIVVLNPNRRTQAYTFGIGALGLNWAMPFRRSDTAAPYSIGFRLNGLSFGEAIWAETDPENSLGRPTASLSASVSGMMSLAAGMFDEVSVDMPFRFKTAVLNGFSLAVGEAAIQGQGELQFSARFLNPATGEPEAKGALDFTITGALAFLDKVGQLNQVDPMMILGAKGGLGMFASPTDTPDSFTSTVEFFTGGGITVNGQHLP